MICGNLVILRHSRHMTQIAKSEKRVARLRTIPSVEPITASAIVATAGSGKQFNNGREFAAWLGLTPLNKSSGVKERLGHISKVGEQYIRRLLVLGMTYRIRSIRLEPEKPIYGLLISYRARRAEWQQSLWPTKLPV